MDYIPYRKDEVDPRRCGHYLSCRGTATSWPAWTSAGPADRVATLVDEYVAGEQVDGYDAIECVAAQPWCDGHVNMMGISYRGFTALQVATLQPPHLTSIIRSTSPTTAIRRLPLPGRLAADVLRPGLVRHPHDRLERECPDAIVASTPCARTWRPAIAGAPAVSPRVASSTRSTGRTGAKGSWRTSRTGSPARRS
jgi:hypothetical protein